MQMNLIGQDEILKKVVGNGPYLIVGPKGSGKTSLAKRIVMDAICERHSGCGECRPCRMFLKGNYPDFYMFSGGKIDEVRELIGRISVKPFYDKYFVLLDDIDKMSIPAQNALLKTIEEPMSAVMFILTGTIQNNILKTIVSRSVKLSPQLLPADVILEELKKKFPEEDPHFLKEASDFAEGSLGYALDIVERKDFYRMLADDIRHIKKRNFFELSNRYAKDYKEEVFSIFDFYEKHLRNKMLSFVKEGKDTSLVYETVRDIEKYRKQLTNNVNLAMVFQNLILKIQQI